MSGCIMCDHSEVLDGGEYVCVKCGIVLGQEYVHGDEYSNLPNRKYENHELYINVCNILEKLNLNPVYADQVYDLLNKYLSNFKCNCELKIGASIFYTLSLHEVPYQLNKISRLICTDINDTKKLFKLIQVFPQKSIVPNDIYRLAEDLFCSIAFNKQDKKKILKLIKDFSCDHCSYSPVTQIAGISYWYFKNYMRRKRSLKSICDHLLISQNSVHLYLKHPCTTSWTLKE